MAGLSCNMDSQLMEASCTAEACSHFASSIIHQKQSLPCVYKSESAALSFSSCCIDPVGYNTRRKPPCFLKAFFFIFFSSPSLNLKRKACVSVSPSTLVRLASRSAMPAGSFTAWSMGSSRTDRCPVTRLSEEETIPSTPSSVRLELESTSPELFLWTWSPLSSMKFALVPTASCSTLSS